MDFSKGIPPEIAEETQTDAEPQGPASVAERSRGPTAPEIPRMGMVIFLLSSSQGSDSFHSTMKEKPKETVEVPVELLEGLLENTRELRTEWSWKGRDSKDILRLGEDVTETMQILAGKAME